ncbi:hypothetical protein GCM10010331_15820 [Streptomyces xanthochromogenes]|nr:hypothetical protein GCM10010331_15820 [Streptomyces xanthochromogenes]
MLGQLEVNVAAEGYDGRVLFRLPGDSTSLIRSHPSTLAHTFPERTDRASGSCNTARPEVSSKGTPSGSIWLTHDLPLQQVTAAACRMVTGGGAPTGHKEKAATPELITGQRWR